MIGVEALMVLSCPFDSHNGRFTVELVLVIIGYNPNLNFQVIYQVNTIN